jgi:hypothetical protein
MPCNKQEAAFIDMEILMERKLLSSPIICNLKKRGCCERIQYFFEVKRYEERGWAKIQIPSQYTIDHVDSDSISHLFFLKDKCSFFIEISIVENFHI